MMGEEQIKEGDKGWLFPIDVTASISIYSFLLYRLTRSLVSWSWGGGKPSGEATEIAKEGEIAIQSSKGNTIKKNADPDDPAVHVSRPGNDVVKRAHELQVEEKADKGADGSTDKADASEEKNANSKQNDTASQASKKRSHSEANEQNDSDEKNNSKTDDKTAENGKTDGGEPPAKKQDTKSGNQPQHAHQAKRGRGRPKGATGKNGEKTKASGKKREPRKAATSTGEPRRSTRHKE